MFKIWHTGFCLTGAQGDGEARALRLPDGPASFLDILPAVRNLADAMVERALVDLSVMGRPVSCGAGCGVCCHHLVTIGEAEALRLARVVRALPPLRRAEVEERFQAGVARLEKSGLLPELVAAFSRQAHDWRVLLRMQRAYWELAIPCPFLEQGSCSIYEERPLVCRQYLVTTPPAACAEPFGPETYLEKALLPMDLAGAAAAFDGSQATNSRVLPHLLCLFREPILLRRTYLLDDPFAMLLRFMDLVDLGYSRKASPDEADEAGQARTVRPQ